MSSITKLTSLDALYASSKILQGIWVFPGTINHQRLSHAIQKFATRHPIFTSTLHRPMSFTSSPFLNHTLESNSSSVIPLHYQTKQKYTNYNINRFEALLPEITVDEIWKGKKSMLEVTLTSFDNGGSSIGIAMSHGVSDACGMHLVVKEIANLYCNENEEEDDSSAIVTSRELLKDLHLKEGLENLIEKNDENSVNLAGVSGRILWWMMQWMNARRTANHRAVPNRIKMVCDSKHKTGIAAQDILHRVLLNTKEDEFICLKTVVNLRALNIGIPLNYVGNAIQTIETIVLKKDIAKGWHQMMDYIKFNSTSKNIFSEFVMNENRLHSGVLFDKDLRVSDNMVKLPSSKTMKTIVINSQVQLIQSSVGFKDGYLFGKEVGEILEYIPGISDELQFVPLINVDGRRGVECLVNMNNI